jgi:hypothetical protein
MASHKNFPQWFANFFQKNFKNNSPATIFPAPFPNNITDVKPALNPGFRFPRFPGLQHVSSEIRCCIVAKCCYFRACRGYQNTNPGQKWPFPKIRMLFFDTTLSILLPEGVISG